jgi:hypothetical protein
MKAFPTFPPSDEGRFVQRRGFWGVVHQGEWIPYALPMGGGTFGTLSTLDTLAATQQSIAAYGEDRAWREVEAALAAHNTQMTQMLGLLVERTEDRQRRYGSAASKTMQVADQFGRPQAQKVTAGVTLGFPLFLFEDALQWTRKFTQANGSAQQLAAEFDAILDADRRQVMYEIKAALMGTGNYTFNDVLVDNVALAVKRLVNADSAAIPTASRSTGPRIRTTCLPPAWPWPRPTSRRWSRPCSSIRTAARSRSGSTAPRRPPSAGSPGSWPTSRPISSAAARPRRT